MNLIALAARQVRSVLSGAALQCARTKFVQLSSQPARQGVSVKSLLDFTETSPMTCEHAPRESSSSSRVSEICHPR